MPKSFPWIVFRKSWQKCSLDILSTYAKKTKNINLKNKISLTYKKYQNGFYVNSENFVNDLYPVKCSTQLLTFFL